MSLNIKKDFPPESQIPKIDPPISKPTLVYPGGIIQMPYIKNSTPVCILMVQ